MTAQAGGATAPGNVRVHSFAVSIDGYAAGVSQDEHHPLGVRGPELMEWFFHTRTWRAMHGLEGGDTGVDDDVAAAAFENIGAWILGRNMFGPIRGPWPDDQWKGWWGEEPPYRVPTFVLTHHERAPVPMKGGTEFRFVTDGIESALRQARAAAGDRNIRIGGGASTIRQFVRARLVDELHLAVRPIVLGAGERLWEGLDWRELGYEVARHIYGERAMHVFLRRQDGL